MGIFEVLDLIGGLALFLFGMNIMGNSLEKKAGGQLKSVLGKMTDNPLIGFLLGFAVTAVIQSSSATTVMAVGFVNSGIMTLHQSIGIIMGANVGTTVTSWILSLAGIDASNSFMAFLKPSSFVPVLAIVGIGMLMFRKTAKSKDTAAILLGFATLMTGMSIMSDAVSGLEDVPEFTGILTLFSNPLLGMLAGALLTAIIQSSSASVGILQILSSTGAITYSVAMPIIMGQNIGTCVTAMLSSFGANKNAKRTAFVHLYFNLLGSIVMLAVFYVVSSVLRPAFVEQPINELGIAVVHTVFNIACTLIWLPFTKLLEKLALLTVRETEEKEKYEMLDERLFTAPAVAVERCQDVTEQMAEYSKQAIDLALESLLSSYDQKRCERVTHLEKRVDKYEDKLGSYLVKISALELTEGQSAQATKLLHMIGDLERISDYAVNIIGSVEEIKEKKLSFSQECEKELEVIIRAVKGVIDISYEAFRENDLDAAARVEPLEQVVDDLKDKLKLRHIKRLQRGECTIELGFVLSDILTSLERVSDHCSNIAGLIIEISHNEMDIHKYLGKVKKDEPEFKERYEAYSREYSLK